MNPDTILLIAITALVALMTIAVWGILFALVKSKIGSNAERTAAISGISEECAEAERVLSSSAAKPMNANDLTSSLLPRIEKARKMLTTNMHLLDVYFVKYFESRLAAFQAEASAHDARSRIEPMPAAPSQPVKAEHKAEHLSLDLSRETVLFKGKDKEIPAGPPDIDLRTGIITVAQEEMQPAKAAQQKPAPKTKPAAPPVTKTPVQAPMKKSKPMTVPENDEFDFEKEMAVHGDRAIPIDDGHESLDTKAIQTDKTMRWNKEELKGAMGRPDSIVVDGAEPSRKPEKPDVIIKAPESKHEDAMISGEDIESTLDSFFGLGDKQP